MEDQGTRQEISITTCETEVMQVAPAQKGAELVQPNTASWPAQHKAQFITLGVFIILALVSFFLLGSIFSNPETYTGITATLDEKKANVMALMTTTTAASAAVSLIPGEAGEPIANKLIDLSSYFMVILAVIYLEKFLIAIFGTLTFQILIPIALVLVGIALFAREGSPTKRNLQKIGMKTAAFGLALFMVVPTSVWISDRIDETFEVSLESANASLQESTTQIEESLQATEEQEGEDSEKSFFDNVMDTVSNGVSTVTGAAQGVLDGFAQRLNQMVDTIAVMIVTSCLIPILVLAFFLWMIKMLTGLDYGSASTVMNAASNKGRTFASNIKSGFAKE